MKRESYVPYSLVLDTWTLDRETVDLDSGTYWCVFPPHGGRVSLDLAADAVQFDDGRIKTMLG